jgi:hypothetical protein
VTILIYLYDLGYACFFCLPVIVIESDDFIIKIVFFSAEIQMQASYYNDRVGVWEPLIEPRVEEENVYRPWEMLVKVLGLS